MRGIKRKVDKMYLISLYFDEQTEERIFHMMKSVAAKSGNNYMLNKNIPPHLTIASVEECEENKIIEALDKCIGKWQQDQLDWTAIGSFKPHVLFLMPVLNTYLHELSVSVNEAFERNQMEQAKNKYLPFQWIPHTTIARTLSEEQMLTAFRVLQANFEPFSGTATRIGLAKSNPYQDIKLFYLK